MFYLNILSNCFERHQINQIQSLKCAYPGSVLRNRGVRVKRSKCI